MQWERLSVPPHSLRVVLILALLGAALLTGLAPGQQQQGPPLPQPRLLTILPLGAKAGTTIELTFTGTDVEEPEGLLFSHPGIKAELLPPPPPPIDPKTNQPVKGAPPPPVRYKVTVPADVPVGIHDVRIFNKWGISNPRAFVVGDQNEVVENEPNNDVAQAHKIELNTTINGVINTPIDVDYFVFPGKKGQRVVISCLASSIDSRLQPVIELYDAFGKRLVTNRNYNDQDAVLDQVLAADGDYYVRLFQFTHTTGNAEHFYRLTVSTAPWIDSVFPSVVEPGKQTQLTLYGRNLPGGQPDPNAVLEGSVLEKLTVSVNVPGDSLARQRLAYSGTITPPGAMVDGIEYRLRNATGVSNPMLLTLAQTPVVLANPGNGTRETAQAVNLPCTVAGRLDRKQPHGWFTFTAAKGAVYTIEVLSERVGSPTDIVMALYNAETKALIVESDDDPELLSSNQFFTRTSDPARYRFVAPTDGKYQLLIKSQDISQLSPRSFYQARISPEQPDFRLVVMAPSAYLPDAPVLYQGSSREYHVYVGRQDNFNGEVVLSAEGLPPGVRCQPQTVSPAFKTGMLVLSAAPDAPPWVGEIKIKGTAVINGQTVVREARAASVTWPGNQQQQNVPTFTRLDRALVLAVRAKGPYALTANLENNLVSQGDKVTIPLKVERFWPDFKGPLPVALASPAPLPGQQPQNLPLTSAAVTIAADKAEGAAIVEVKANAPPGDYTLVFRGNAQFPFGKDPAKKANVNVLLPSTPVLVTVLPKQLGTVTLAPPNATGKPGTATEIMVKVARLYDFNGEFKVEVTLPPNAKGVTIPEVTIPAGKDEAKLVINVAEDAPPGNLQGLVVKATALYNGKHPTVQEAKFNLNIAK